MEKSDEEKIDVVIIREEDSEYEGSDMTIYFGLCNGVNFCYMEVAEHEFESIFFPYKKDTFLYDEKIETEIKAAVADYKKNN